MMLIFKDMIKPGVTTDCVIDAFEYNSSIPEHLFPAPVCGDEQVRFAMIVYNRQHKLNFHLQVIS